jgi:ParB/RepB/Spo0J family partition protein
MNPQTATEYCNLPLNVLTESTTNPRRAFENAALKELAESIRVQGVLSPLLVRPINEQGFEIVAGARRYRAAQMAEAATVPVRIVNLTDAESLEAQLVENLIRSDVHPMEEAKGSLVELHPDNRVVELSFVSSTPFILCRGRSLSEPAVLHKRTNVSCGFIPPRAG